MYVCLARNKTMTPKVGFVGVQGWGKECRGEPKLEPKAEEALGSLLKHNFWGGGGGWHRTDGRTDMDLYSRYGQARQGRQVVLRSLWLSKLREVTV